MVTLMTIVSRVKRYFENPLIFGLSSGVAVVLLIISAATIGGGSIQEGLTMFRSNGIFAYLVPLSVAVQMGLFKHHRNITKAMMIPNTEKIGVSGSALPSMVMLVCCVCCVLPVTALLPAMGFILAASSFLTEYSFAIITIALLANAIGSIIIYYAILQHKKGKQIAVYSQLMQYK